MIYGIINISHLNCRQKNCYNEDETVVFSDQPAMPPKLRFQQIARRIRERNTRDSVLLLSVIRKRQEKKALCTITLFITVFIVFKLPLAVILMVYAVCRTECITVNVYEAFTWLYYAECLFDPFLYAFISKRFQNHCRRMFRKMAVFCTRPCTKNKW